MMSLNNTNNQNIESWVHKFLKNEGNNKALSDGLKLTKRNYIGPLELPITLLKRCCGPEVDMPFKEDKDTFENKISQMIKSIQNGWQPQPLIVEYKNTEFILSDGSHRFEAFKRLGIKKCVCIIWTTGESDYSNLKYKILSYPHPY
jgi:hypothetical protein